MSDGRELSRNGATVRDVMTSRVIAVTPDADFRQIALLFRRYRVSACPVVNEAGQVVGVVSEADLLCKPAESDFPAGLTRLEWRLSEQSKAAAITAGQLMTAPPVAVHPDAPVTAAARVMQERRIKRLPVVDDNDRLVGIISRVDVLSVYERPDAAIQEEVLGQIIAGEFGLNPYNFDVSVAAGIVTLAGPVDDLETALNLVARTRHVEGVVATRDRLTVTGE